MRKLHEKNTIVNEGCLTDATFQPKSFIVRIEQGAFQTPASAESMYESVRAWPPDYTKRLVFYISPYRPESEWKEDWKEDWLEPEGNTWWDCKEFVSHYHSRKAQPAVIDKS
jgi:hypothetical protein